MTQRHCNIQKAFAWINQNEFEKVRAIKIRHAVNLAHAYLMKVSLYARLMNFVIEWKAFTSKVAYT